MSLRRPEFRDYLTIFLVSCAIMLYQITLTRVLSVVVWYHFAFLTISMVMLGLGVPGVWFALAKRPLRFLPGFLLASGITVPLSVFLIVKFGALMLAESAAFIVLCVLPATLSLGGVICLMLIKAAGPAITRMYGVDLLGAGLGAVLVIPIMHLIPTPVFAASSALLPLVCLVFHPGVLRRVSIALMLAQGVLIAHGGAYQVTHSKLYDEKLHRPVFEDWSPTARITIFDESFFFLAQHEAGFSWGRGANFPAGEKVRQYWLEQDGSAGSAISAFDGDLSRVEYLLYDVATVGYQLRAPESVAVIGAGGGRDILAALLVGARDIDAVELNSHTIEAVSETFADVSGDVYHRPGVHAVANEGRSHLTHTDKTFDLIQISLIDSWAASAAGAFALAENNLYTVEAFQLYHDRLTEHGIISTSRWMNETPRLIVLARAALQSIGVDDPRDHMIVVGAGGVGTLLTSGSRFSATDLQRLDEICEQRGFERLFPVPPTGAPDPFIARTAEHGLASMANLGLNVEPPTDDSPYFFHLVSPFVDSRKLGDEVHALTGLGMNLGSSRVLRQAMIGVVVLSLLLFMLPFAARIRKSERGEPLAHLLRASIFFAAIGCAFMLLENVLVQRFVLYLGHPSYATTVIIAVLLIGMGVGSTQAERVGIDRLKRLGLALPVALLVMLGALPHLFAATLGWSLAGRIGISCVILLPLGAGLGLFFPLGMLRFGDRAKPWYWAINGVFGVVASVLSLALSMEFGFSMVGVLSAIGYFVAWCCLHGQPPLPELESGVQERP